MKNEPAGLSFWSDDTGCDAKDVITKNLEDISRSEAHIHERKFAHIDERAKIISEELKDQAGNDDIMSAISRSYEASEIYGYLKGEACDMGKHFADSSFGSASCISGMSKKLDDLYLCKRISCLDGKKYEKQDITRWLCEIDDNAPAYNEDKKVSFVRGSQSGRAFERFAKYVPGVLAEYEEDFRSACEAVANGESTYAIVPIENSMDGRLNSFYRLIEKYALFIVLTVDIPSDDYESSTKFALVYKNLDIISADGTNIFECKITFRDQSEIANIILASEYFGASVHKIYSLPLSSGGRENSFDIVFDITDADIAGFFCYLFLEYPYFATIGYYTMMEGWS